jgi:hypothetical protein
MVVVEATLMSTGCSGGRPGCPVLEGEVDTVTRFPGKVAMRLVNDRPPCLETPWRYFRNDSTPNEAFYVCWHLQAFPMAVDPGTGDSASTGPSTVPWSCRWEASGDSSRTRWWPSAGVRAIRAARSGRPGAGKLTPGEQKLPACYVRSFFGKQRDS